MTISFLICLANIVLVQSCEFCEQEKVSITYDHEDEGNLDLIDGLAGDLYIVFESDFEDSISVFNNGVLVSCDFYKTNASTSFTQKYVKVLVGSTTANTLKIVLNEKNKCIEFNSDPRFPILRVSRLGPEWFLMYTFSLPNYE